MLIPAPSEIGLIVHVRDRIDRAAMNTHAQFELRTALQFLADFERALNGCFRIIRKDEHHPIARRQTRQLALSFGGLELLVSRTIRLSSWINSFCSSASDFEYPTMSRNRI